MSEFLPSLFGLTIIWAALYYGYSASMRKYEDDNRQSER